MKAVNEDTQYEQLMRGVGVDCVENSPCMPVNQLNLFIRHHHNVGGSHHSSGEVRTANGNESKVEQDVLGI